ncbi:MarR family winged helix-turn-helix transcriptional regulator [Saccharopolyspora shandongensis]|uniref:MarR family winged helix-turn-helix transcriptional regulator n=1 Tax=Saccharopolyspora shandongensis TaxID=418495 RepID=UPI0034036572
MTSTALSPAEIAENCLVSGGAITQRVARAEESGLVRSQRSASGKRTVMVELTPRGHQAIERNIEVLIGRERQLLAGMPAGEQRQLEGLLRDVLAQMSGD